jgi:DNA-binding NarL/FixJ family response regulator
MSENVVTNGSPVRSGDIASGPKIRIVVADDHPIFRDGLCKLLALEEDFEVVAQAQDGRQVLEVLQQLTPDILLLDLKMPGLDGLATLQRLQAVKNKTRVIVSDGVRRQE